MTNSIDDLLKRAQAGDAGALDRLLTEVRRAVLRYLLARGQSRADAEDIAQDVCVAVMKVVPKWVERGRSLWGFVFTTAHNATIDGHRRRQREAVEPLGEAADRLRASTDTQPEHLVMAGESNAAMTEILEQLPATQRDVIVMRAVVGLTTAETAAALGLAHGSIHVLQHRAVKKLRQLLSNSNGNVSLLLVKP